MKRKRRRCLDLATHLKTFVIFAPKAGRVRVQLRLFRAGSRPNRIAGFSRRFVRVREDFSHVEHQGSCVSHGGR
jgi:hypothetical protein